MLSDKIDSSLINLSEYVHLFKLGVTEAINSANKLQHKLRTLVLVVELILSLLLFWQAAAQWSLALQGRRIMRTAE